MSTFARSDPGDGQVEDLTRPDDTVRFHLADPNNLPRGLTLVPAPAHGHAEMAKKIDELNAKFDALTKAVEDPSKTTSPASK